MYTVLISQKKKLGTCQRCIFIRLQIMSFYTCICQQTVREGYDVVEWYSRSINLLKTIFWFQLNIVGMYLSKKTRNVSYAPTYRSHFVKCLSQWSGKNRSMWHEGHGAYVGLMKLSKFCCHISYSDCESDLNAQGIPETYRSYRDWQLSITAI